MDTQDKLKKRAMDALLEMINDPDYATHQHHSDPNFTTQTGKDYEKGTEMEDGVSVTIPAKDFHTAAPLEEEITDAEFYKESDIPSVEEEAAEHEFFKESLTQDELKDTYEMTRGSDRRAAYIVRKNAMKAAAVLPAFKVEDLRAIGRGGMTVEQWKAKEPTTAAALDAFAVEVGFKTAHANFPDPGSLKGVLDGPHYDEKEEAHTRREAGERAQYAESGEAYDPKGDYLCGTCNMRTGENQCSRVDGDISFTAGSCRLYHLGAPENKAPMPKKFDKVDAGYTERPNVKGFGCKRCEYGSEAGEPDSAGRPSWCSFWGMHVIPDACCAENEGEDDLSFNKDGSKKANFVPLAALAKTAPTTPAFKAWFGNSKVVDAQGNPQVMYHATQKEIDVFLPYTHFGTQGAANDRDNTLRDFYDNTIKNPQRSHGANVVPVYLSVKNPLRMQDLASVDSNTGEWLASPDPSAVEGEEQPYARSWEGEEAVATTLLEMGIIDIDEFEDHRSNEKAFELLKQKGYDGIVYKNTVEDAGRDSWIVFSPAQIKSAIGNSGKFGPENSITAAASKLYHVTFTAKVPSIREKGILPLQDSNWVQAKDRSRYGEGEIFAFDTPADAVRWAGKMDWEFNQSGGGSGKISIVIFKPGKEKWEVDTADPLSQASAKGKWLKAHGAIKPEQIINIVPVTTDMVRAMVKGKDVKLGRLDKQIGEADEAIRMLEQEILNESAEGEEVESLLFPPVVSKPRAPRTPRHVEPSEYPHEMERIRSPRRENEGHPLPDLEFQLGRPDVPTARKPSMDEQEEKMSSAKLAGQKESFIALDRRWSAFYTKDLNQMADRDVTLESCKAAATKIRDFAARLTALVAANPKNELFKDAFVDDHNVTSHITSALERVGIADEYIWRNEASRLDTIRHELMSAGSILRWAYDKLGAEFYYLEKDRTASSKVAGQKEKFESLKRKWDKLKQTFQQRETDVAAVKANIPKIRKFAEELLELVESGYYTLLPNPEPERANVTPSLREGLKRLKQAENAVADYYVMQEEGSTDEFVGGHGTEALSLAVHYVDVGFGNQAVEYYHADKRKDAATKSYGTGLPLGGATNQPPEDEEALDAEDAQAALDLMAQDEATNAKAATLAMSVDFSPIRIASLRLAASDNSGWFQKSARPTPEKLDMLQKQFKLTPEQIELCIAADPSPNQTDYVAWLAKWLSKGQLHLPEDTDKIKGQLQTFTKLKRSPAFTHNKDIQQYDPGKLFEVLESGGAGGALSKKEQDRETVAKGSKIIINDGGVTVYKVTDGKALSLLSGGTNWCTADAGTGSNYLKNGPSYVIFEDGTAFAQFHPASNQLMNRQDVCMLEKVYGEKSRSRGWGRSAPKRELIASFITDQTLLAVLQKLSAIEPDVKKWVEENTTNQEDLVKILGERAGEEQRNNERLWSSPSSYYDSEKKWTMTVQHALASEQQLSPETEAKLATGVSTDLLFKYGTKFHAGQAWEPLGKAVLAQKGVSKEIIDYAVKFLKGRWPEGEAKLLKGALLKSYNSRNMKLALEYAQRMVKGRWVELEAKFHRAKPSEASGYGSAEYAINVLKQRWTTVGVKPRKDGKVNEEEIIIIGNPDEAQRYAATFMPGQRWQEFEQSALAANHLSAMTDYAMNVVKGRMPELEQAILNGKVNPSLRYIDTDLALNYAQKVLKARWPEYEQRILTFVKDTVNPKGSGSYGGEYHPNNRGISAAERWNTYHTGARLPKVVENYIEEMLKGRWPELEQALLARYQEHPEDWNQNQILLDGYLRILLELCQERYKNELAALDNVDARTQQLHGELNDWEAGHDQAKKEVAEAEKAILNKDAQCVWPEGEQRLEARDENFETILLGNLKKRGDERHAESIHKDKDKEKDWVNFKGYWLTWYGNDEIEKYVQYLDSVDQNWPAGGEIMNAIADIDDEKYGTESWRPKKKRHPTSIFESDRMQQPVQSSLLKKAAVEFHETPKLKPPREQYRTHIDVEAQRSVMEGVMDGVMDGTSVAQQPVPQKQIDPRLNPDGEDNWLNTPMTAAEIEPEIVSKRTGNWKLFAWPAGTVQFGQYGEIKRPVPKGQVWYVGDKKNALPIMKENWGLTHEQENQLLERGSLNLEDVILRLTNVDYYAKSILPPAGKLLKGSLLNSAAEFELKTDALGILWGISPEGYRVSIPKSVVPADYAEYLRPRFEEQAKHNTTLQDRLKSEEQVRMWEFRNQGSLLKKMADRKSDKAEAEDQAFLKLLENDANEAYEAFVKEPYILQEAQDRNAAVETLWDEIGKEYTNQYFTSKKDREPEDWHAHR
jgi:hypothetical protein